MYKFVNEQHGHSFMTAYDLINTMANSQGFYSRLLYDMIDNDWEPLYELTMEVYFEEPLEFIMYIEC